MCVWLWELLAKRPLTICSIIRWMLVPVSSLFLLLWILRRINVAFYQLWKSFVLFTRVNKMQSEKINHGFHLLSSKLTVCVWAVYSGKEITKRKTIRLEDHQIISKSVFLFPTTFVGILSLNWPLILPIFMNLCLVNRAHVTKKSQQQWSGKNKYVWKFANLKKYHNVATNRIIRLFSIFDIFEIFRWHLNVIECSVVDK